MVPLNPPCLAVRDVPQPRLSFQVWLMYGVCALRHAKLGSREELHPGDGTASPATITLLFVAASTQFLPTGLFPFDG